MEATMIIVVAAVGAAALVGWLSRNKIAQELETANAKLRKLEGEASIARRAAERAAEDKKGRADELVSTRAKLRETRRRLHQTSEELDRERGGSLILGEEHALMKQQVSSVREENEALGRELGKLRETLEAERREREKRSAARAREVQAVPLSAEQADERLAQMARQVEEAEARVRELEKRAQDSRKQAESAKDELKRVRGKAEANHRVYLVTKGESELWMAKFGALEQRWNELWRELEGIDWKPRTQKDLGDQEKGAERRRGPRRDRVRRPRPKGAPAEVASTEAGAAQEQGGASAAVEGAAAAPAAEKLELALAASAGAPEGAEVPVAERPELVATAALAPEGDRPQGVTSDSSPEAGVAGTHEQAAAPEIAPAAGPEIVAVAAPLPEVVAPDASGPDAEGERASPTATPEPAA